MMVRESLKNSSPLEVQNRSLKFKDSICELSIRHQVLIASQSRCFRYGGKMSAASTHSLILKNAVKY